MQGEPVITKDEEVDLPPCYTGRTVTVSNGEGHGSQTYSAECFKEGSGTYSSDVIWTPPPAYMKPGSIINFSMTFTSPNENPISGAIKADGETIVEGDSRNPGGRSAATYTVPKGSPRAQLEVYTSFIMISGLHGYVVYNYMYERPDPRSSKTFNPRSLKPRTGYYIRFSDLWGDLHGHPANVYVVRDGKKILAQDGFQMRVGDFIEVPDVGIVTMYYENEPNWSMDLISGSKLDMADVGAIEEEKEARKQESAITLLAGRCFIRLVGGKDSHILGEDQDLIDKEDDEIEKELGEELNPRLKMRYGFADVKHTFYICEQTSVASILKVLNGTVKFTSNVTGEQILVNSGEMATATDTGLSPLESFDVEAEKAKWEPYLPSTEVTKSKESKVIFNSWNLGSVVNAPTCSPFFTINEPQMITYIDSYHWNYGQGAPAGTIGLRDGYGTIFGPWQAETSHDGGEVPRGYWIVHPQVAIPPGTYTIEDSDPDTWSKNSESPCGLARVEGYAVEPSASRESDIVATNTKETSSAKGTSSRPPAAGTADAGVAGSQGGGSMAEEGKIDAGKNSHAADSATSDSGKVDLAVSNPEQSSIEEISYPTATDRSTEIRGQMATGDFEWPAQNFAGFYYDPDKDVGAEVLTAALRDGRLSGSQPFGLYYQTAAQRQDYSFQDWGSYQIMGFLGDKHFAGYVEGLDSENGYLFDHSGDKSALAKGQLLKILTDDDTETTITTNTPLQLKDGYELSIKSIDIDGNVVDLELIRDGTEVDSAKVSPSRDGAAMADQTYLYKKDIGDLKDLVVIAVHFKNAFRGADQDLATVDGQWQLSEKPVYVTEGSQFGKMTVQSVTDDAISMANQGEDITLSRNKDISIMPGMGIKTADADELRYYIYREITEPGIHEIRSTVETTDYAAWTAAEFAGFYYDLDQDIVPEMLAAKITDGKLAEPDGIRYTTGAIAADFKFEDWGSYDVIGFLGEKCFAGYIDGSDSGKGYLFDKSSDKSALAKGQLSRILLDDDKEQTITSNTPLMLADGYRLEIKAVNPNDGRVYVELRKDDELIDARMFQPSKDDATLSDRTYFYRNPSVGNQNNLVTIAVHFKNAFRGADQDLATIDGVWQISGSPITVSRGTCFDKLTVSNVTDRSIAMNNIDQTITLSRDKHVSLAGDIFIRTADSDSLRYYIVKEVCI